MNNSNLNSIFLLSGTPGTGKTTLVHYLHDHYQYQYISLGEEVLANNLFSREDPTRDTKIVDEKKFNQFFTQKLQLIHEPVIVEAHYADMLENPRISLGFILRCHPHILEARLQTRNYTQDKINENIQAELVGDSTSYMLDHPNLTEEHKIFELDSSNTSLSEIAEQMIQIIKDPLKFRHLEAGWLSWLSDPTVDPTRYIQGAFKK